MSRLKSRSLLYGPRRLWLLLAIAWGLRIALVLGGGRFFLPDEIRFARGEEFNALLGRGQFGQALDLITTTEHSGFTLVASLPAALQQFVQRLPGASSDAGWVAAALLSLASVVCIAMVYLIAREAGADEDEAFIAGLLAASATTLFYYARHLVPYDASLALMLTALWLGLKPHQPMWRSFLVGIFAAFSFLVYNGYWTGVLLIAIIYLMQWPDKTYVSRFIRRTVGAGAGVAAVLALVVWLSSWHARTPLMAIMSRFAGTVNQGEFSEGWRLPWAYLWDTEHFLLLIWVVSALLILWQVVRQRNAWPGRRRGMLWLGAALSIYGFLVIGSVGLGKFVVYGRSVRLIAPFLCLATAWVLTKVAGGWLLRPRPLVLGLAVLAVSTALNFGVPLSIKIWPRDILAQAMAAYPDLYCDVTVKGPVATAEIDLCGMRPSHRRSDLNQVESYVLLDVIYPYPVLGPVAVPDGEEISRNPHPFRFRPYLYESYGPRERSVLASSYTDVRLFKISNVSQPTKQQ